MIENGSFWIFWEKLGYFHRTSVCNVNLCFPSSNQSICQSIKENELLWLWPHRLLCFAGLRTQKRKSDLYCNPLYTFNNMITSITTMKIKFKCKLTNHIYWRNIVSFLSPLCHEVSIPASTQRRAINSPPTIGHCDGISLAGRWWPDVVCFLGW